jgi:hypothetical protein
MPLGFLIPGAQRVPAFNLNGHLFVLGSDHNPCLLACNLYRPPLRALIWWRPLFMVTHAYMQPDTPVLTRRECVRSYRPPLRALIW